MAVLTYWLELFSEINYDQMILIILSLYEFIGRFGYCIINIDNVRNGHLGQKDDDMGISPAFLQLSNPFVRSLNCSAICR